MKLIDIIGKLILEQVSDEEERPTERETERETEIERPDDKERPFDVPDDEEIFDFPTEDDRVRFCRRFVGGDRSDIPERCIDIVRRMEDERPRDEPSDERPSDERPSDEPRITSEPSREEEPTTNTQSFKPKKVKEPRKTLTRKAPPEKKQTDTSSSIKTTPKKDVKVNPQYSSDSDIKNINQARPQKYLERVISRLEKQLINQEPQIKRRLTQLNITPKNMANLVPLSTESGVLMSKMELDGLNLPLMMVLYNNTPALYKSMKNNKPLKKNDVKPITGSINYKDFWKWNKDVYGKWGGWLKSNVVGNFPEISRNTFPSLSF